MFIRCFCR